MFHSILPIEIIATFEESTNKKEQLLANSVLGWIPAFAGMTTIKNQLNLFLLFTFTHSTSLRAGF
jgi:hypothetical protein